MTPSGQTPTPTPTPTSHTPSPTGTETTPGTITPTPFVPEQANVNCDDAADMGDVIVMLEARGGVEYDQEPGCPDPGDSFGGIVFGDVNCDGVFDVWDALDLLLILAGLQPLGGVCDA